MRLLLSISLCAACLGLAVPAGAVTVAPEPCPAPADLAPYAQPESVSAPDLNGPAVLPPEAVLEIPVRAGVRTRRGRPPYVGVYVDPRTGEAVYADGRPVAPPQAGCVRD